MAMILNNMCVFFFKQKTAYEMRISDWSSDVCSSDLVDAILRRGDPLDVAMHAAAQGLTGADRAFAVAIASEAMRWMVDIDTLIDGATAQILPGDVKRSEEHTSELQSIMRTSYAVFC